MVDPGWHHRRPRGGRFFPFEKYNFYVGTLIAYRHIVFKLKKVYVKNCAHKLSNMCTLPPRPPTHQPNSEKIFFYGFIHFMKFPAILVQVYFNLPPMANTENFCFHRFIHFMKFLACDDYCMLTCWDVGSTHFIKKYYVK